MRARLAALVLALALAATAASPETVIAQRTLRATAVIGPSDVGLGQGETPGAFSNPLDVIGQEARVVLYAGRPVMLSDVGPPALVDRNQIVRLIFRAGAISIHAEGRALGRGGIGDTLRVMNLDSRNTVTGLVGPDGSVHVLGPARPTRP